MDFRALVETQNLCKPNTMMLASMVEALQIRTLRRKILRLYIFDGLGHHFSNTEKEVKVYF